jgi:hypothetical protein
MVQVWGIMSIISTLRRLRQENGEFKASQGYISRPRLKEKKNKNNNNNNKKQKEKEVPQNPALFCL